METRRKTIIAIYFYYGELVMCINIVCSCVADNQRFNQTCCFRGGFSRRISVADFASDFPFDLSTSRGGFAADFSKSCGGFCGGFLRRICSCPKPCKLHIKIAPKIHHKNPPHSSPHARLVCDYTLPAFFTACFAACPSTGILHYVTYTADFFRGGF